MFINVHNKTFTLDSKWNTRCKDSAKNRFSKEKENNLSFLSVRFLFKSKTKQNKCPKVKLQTAVETTVP